MQLIERGGGVNGPSASVSKGSSLAMNQRTNFIFHEWFISSPDLPYLFVNTKRGSAIFFTDNITADI